MTAGLDAEWAAYAGSMAGRDGALSASMCVAFRRAAAAEEASVKIGLIVAPERQPAAMAEVNRLVKEGHTRLYALRTVYEAAARGDWS